ncbi:hypothetical protein [Amycolatopsis sp. NPDC004378]
MFVVAGAADDVVARFGSFVLQPAIRMTAEQATAAIRAFMNPLQFNDQLRVRPEAPPRRRFTRWKDALLLAKR